MPSLLPTTPSAVWWIILSSRVKVPETEVSLKVFLVRYFTQLIQQERLDAPIQKRYLQFMQLNAETLWNQGTNKPGTLFGPNWRVKPGATVGLTEQLSGCMLIEAAALLDKQGYLLNRELTVRLFLRV